MTGQRAQVAGGIDEFGNSADFVGLNRDAAQRRLARQQRLDLLLAFLGLERADAIDDPAAGLDQRGGAVEQAALQRR